MLQICNCFNFERKILPEIEKLKGLNCSIGHDGAARDCARSGQWHSGSSSASGNSRRSVSPAIVVVLVVASGSLRLKSVSSSQRQSVSSMLSAMAVSLLDSSSAMWSASESEVMLMTSSLSGTFGFWFSSREKMCQRDQVKITGPGLRRKWVKKWISWKRLMKKNGNSLEKDWWRWVWSQCWV